MEGSASSDNTMPNMKRPREIEAPNHKDEEGTINKRLRLEEAESSSATKANKHRIEPQQNTKTTKKRRLATETEVEGNHHKVREGKRKGADNKDEKALKRRRANYLADGKPDNPEDSKKRKREDITAIEVNENSDEIEESDSEPPTRQLRTEPYPTHSSTWNSWNYWRLPPSSDIIDEEDL